MATLAELWDDTPAAKPLPAAPKLTVVPATPPPPAPAVQAAPAPQPAPAPALVLQAAPAPPPIAAAPAPVPARVTQQEQQARDKDALAILTQELAKAEAQAAAGNPRAVQDVAALKREITKRGFSIPVAPAAAPAAAASAPQKGSDVGSLGDLFETTIPANQPGSVVQKPVAKTVGFSMAGQPYPSGGDGPIAQAAKKYLGDFGKVIRGTAEVLPAMAGGAVSGVVTPIAQLGHELFSGQAFTQEGKAAAAEFGKKVQEQFYQPRTEEGQQYTAAIGNALAPLIGVPIPTLDALSRAAPAAVRAIGDVGRSKSIGGTAVEVPRIEPTLPPEPLDVNLRPVEVTVPGQMSPKMLRETQAAFEKRQQAAAAAKAAMPPPAATTAFDILGGDRTPAGPAVALPAGAAAGAGATPGSVGAAAASANPFAGKLTGEVAGSKGQFPQIKLSLVAENVPVTEQQLISRIAQEVNPGQPVRSGVITRNEGTLRTEHTEANMPNLTPRGQVLKTQIANEQNALTNFSKERIDATGASPTLLSDSMRGERINDVFHGAAIEGEAPTSLTAYLDQSKRQIYKSALERVGNNQIKTSNIDNLLKNPQWKAGLEFKGVEGVAKGAEKYLNLAKTTGFEDVNGVMHPPGTVSTYDAVRKAVNAEWSPQNASAIRKINEAIDKDIAAVADPALYKLGDKIHQVEKTIFGSKGIKSLFGEVDKNGVVLSSTPLEKIPTKLNELAKDQWKHIRGTLDELANGQVRGAPNGMPPVPAELRQAAAAARNEIDGALARAVYQAGSNKAGVWNQNSVNTTLNSVIGEKILENFSPAEVKKFHTLNTAGYLMPGVHSYEGAALQARRAGKIEAYAEKAGIGAGAATGGFVGSAFGPAGTTAGTVIGGEAGRRVGASISGKAAAKAEAKAADALRNEMQKNAQLRDMLP